MRQKRITNVIVERLTDHSPCFSVRSSVVLRKGVDGVKKLS